MSDERAVPSTEEKIAYGGQAVLEGVMMRSRRRVATALRHPAGHIVVRADAIVPGYMARALRRIPVLRGAAALWDVMALGMMALAFSASVAIEEEAPADGQDGRDEAGSAFIWAWLVIGIGLGIGLFLVVPVLLTRLLDPAIESDTLSNLVEGLIRLGILLAYLGGIGFVPDIRRTFAYHGAEHKAVNAVEAADALSVDRVMRHSRAHPRCGTNFLLTVVLLSIVVFALLGRPELPLRIASRVALIPLIAGLGYEIIKFLAARRGNLVAALALKPGLWLQALTTREPTAAQVEVAIVAMASVLQAEGELDRLPLVNLPASVSYRLP